MQLAAFDGPSRKTPLWAQKSRKNLLRKPSYSQFCPKFRCHGNGGRSGKNAIGNIRWPIFENPLNAQNLPKIFYTSRVTARFIPNFVAMATGVSREKIQLAAFDGPSLKTAPIGAKISQKSRKNLLRKPSYSQFCPKFALNGNGGQSGKMQLAAFDFPSPKTPL